MGFFPVLDQPTDITTCRRHLSKDKFFLLPSLTSQSFLCILLHVSGKKQISNLQNLRCDQSLTLRTLMLTMKESIEIIFKGIANLLYNVYLRNELIRIIFPYSLFRIICNFSLRKKEKLTNFLNVCYCLF